MKKEILNALSKGKEREKEVSTIIRFAYRIYASHRFNFAGGGATYVHAHGIICISPYIRNMTGQTRPILVLN